MKFIPLIFALLTAFPAAAEEFNFVDFRPVPATQNKINLSYFSPEVQAIIAQEARRYVESPAQQAKKMIVVTTPPEPQYGPVKVFGFTEQDVLAHDGDPQGAACSSQHNQGDMSNRWCHAYFVKLTNSYLLSQGVNKQLSAVLSASIFVPKEYLYDLHPSKSDLVMAEYEVFSREKRNRKTRMTMTVFGDKAMFLTFEKQF